MPFRAKVKKAFGKSNEDPSENSSDLPQIQSKPSTKKSKKQKVEYPDNIYKPGEIPASKYNGPYDKKHQQKLHAFSFANAFQGRRKSEHSLYSPMGSRLPSRVSSFISRRSFGPRSRQQSRVEDTLMENNEADDADEDVCKSPQHTGENRPRPRTRESHRVDGYAKHEAHESNMMNVQGNGTIEESERANGYELHEKGDGDRMDGLEPTKTLTDRDSRQLNGGSFGQPFSANDLVHAMTQSSLKPSAVQA
ncbi:MAG: hypothetical protein Q9181_000781 [Wetmoreana brouardii]